MTTPSEGRHPTREDMGKLVENKQTGIRGILVCWTADDIRTDMPACVQCFSSQWVKPEDWVVV